MTSRGAPDEDTAAPAVAAAIFLAWIAILAALSSLGCYQMPAPRDPAPRPRPAHLQEVTYRIIELVGPDGATQTGIIVWPAERLVDNMGEYERELKEWRER